MPCNSASAHNYRVHAASVEMLCLLDIIDTHNNNDTKMYVHDVRHDMRLSGTVLFPTPLPHITICLLFGLISWSLTTRCLTVTGGGSVVSAADSVSPADFWAHYNIVIFTCVLVGSAGARKFHLGDYSPGGMGDGSSSWGPEAKPR